MHFDYARSARLDAMEVRSQPDLCICFLSVPEPYVPFYGRGKFGVWDGGKAD